MNKFFNKKSFWYSIFLTAIICGLINLVIYNQADYYNLYSAPKKANLTLDFKFYNKSDLLDIAPYRKTEYRSSDSAHAITGDLDNDNYEDFIFIGKMKKKSLLKIQMNKGGKHFSSNTALERMILNTLHKYDNISTLAIVDIDNDGRNDIVLVAEGCVSFFRGIDNTIFSTNSIPSVCTEGDKRNINLVDVNKDGYVDLYFSSYQNKSKGWEIPAVSNGRDGGKNILLLNQKGRSFIDVTDQYKIENLGLTWSAAISDFNNDGYPDILDINDFGYNRYFENDRGQRFIDKTNSSLNITHISYSMSGEVADFNNDGRFDVYISNTNRLADLKGNNLLLINRHDGRFVNTSKETSTSACGWSWGAKAFEPNHDLNTSLFIVNAPSLSVSQIEQSTLYSAPLFLRKLIKNNFGDIIPRVNFMNISKFPQSNCLFHKLDGQYIDIASNVGINDIQGGKAISEFDFNNDGASDFLIANIDSSPILYQGSYTGPNNWIGFSLQGTISNKNAIGATIEIEFDKGKKIKQIFPTNGYQSQSSYRLIFGVPVGYVIKSIHVKWPTGAKIRIEKYELNRYNQIIES